MSGVLTREQIVQKLVALQNTLPSIQATSTWLLFHRRRLKDHVVPVWMDLLRDGAYQMRLLLLYLANDVMQNAKKKGQPDVVEAFAPVLPQAMELCMDVAQDTAAQGSVKRLYEVWKEREVVSQEVLREIEAKLNLSNVDSGSGGGGGGAVAKPSSSNTVSNQSSAVSSSDPKRDAFMAVWVEADTANRLEETLRGSKEEEQRYVVAVQVAVARNRELADAHLRQAQHCMQQVERLEAVLQAKGVGENGSQGPSKKLRAEVQKDLQGNPQKLNEVTKQLLLNF